MNEQHEQQNAQQAEVAQPQPVVAQPVASTPQQTDSGEVRTIQSVERITAWVMVLSAIFFAVISILSIWRVFGDSASEIVWRSLTSLGVIAFTALVVNVGARMIDGRKK